MNKHKVLFVGDPHFKLKNIEYVPLFISKILDMVTHGEFDFVVVAGDVLDNHAKIDVEPLNLAVSFIDSLGRFTKTFVLVGNHDYKNNQQFLSTHHWMNALKNWPNVVIVDEVVEHERFLFVPYVPPGRFVEALETKVVGGTEKLETFKAVFAHQEFRGCKMGSILSQVGDQWDPTWPTVVSGHIHEKQWSQPNVYYPGSAIQHAFGHTTPNTVSVLYWTEDAQGLCSLAVEEVDLKMPRLSIKYLTVQEVMEPLKFKESDCEKYKIVVKGDAKEVECFKKNPRYHLLLEEGFKVVFRSNEVPSAVKVVDAVIAHRKGFLDVLRERIHLENNNLLTEMSHKFL
jgi:DNA repair exonuclease SbcCD nuclease subunit